jgi:hypothetical protein
MLILTFSLLLNKIHTENVRVLVPIAKRRYHHHPGLDLSRSTFMPKRDCTKLVSHPYAYCKQSIPQ